MKIGLFGASGTGKTTMAKHIEQITGKKIPYVSCAASDLFPKYGFKTHRDVLNADQSTALAFQMDLLQFRKDKLKGHDSFITDRTPMDNATYFLTQSAPNLSNAVVKEYMSLCEESLNDYDLLVHMPVNTFKWEDEGKRVESEDYHWAWDLVAQGLLKRFAEYTSVLGSCRDWNYISYPSWKHKTSIESRACDIMLYVNGNS